MYTGDAGQTASNHTQVLVDTANAAVSDTVHHCASIAISWAQCNQPTSFYTNLDNIFAKGASEGQSIFVATGDVGTAAPAPGSCAVPPTPAKPYIEENAGSPHVTAVGATMFQPKYNTDGNDTSTDANTQQRVWDFSITGLFNIRGASTGGFSKIFSKPTWQAGVVGISGNFRAVPDLVLGGGNLGGMESIQVVNKKLKITGSTYPAPGFWECFDNGWAHGSNSAQGPSWSTTGGTSIVPPQYAAIFAIIAQKTGKLQGLINPKLYAMAKANLKKPAAVGLIDIVTGNDAYAPEKGYAAKKGFDLASGWGAIDFTNFVNSFIAFP